MKPILPRYVMPENNANFQQANFNAYKARLEMHKVDLVEFEHQTKAFGNITLYIQETVSANNATFIQTEEPHSWDQLQAFKG